MTQRTQITLPAEDHRRARRRAGELGISLAAYLRNLVQRDLERPKARADVSALFALGNSQDADVARHKDDYVAEAIVARRVKR